MRGLDLIGAEADYSDLFKAAAGGAVQITKSALADRAAKKTAAASAAEDDRRAREAVAADQAATTVGAEAIYAESIAAKDPSPAYAVKARAARGAADQAESAAARAGEGLSDAARKQRLVAADANATRYAAEATVAASASAASPKDAALLDKAQHATMYTLSAQAVARRARGEEAPPPAEMVKLAEKPGASLDGGSWLTRKVVGPIPGYGVVVGGVGLLGVVALLLRRLFR